MKGKALIKMLEQAGWTLVRNSSHKLYTKEGKRLVIPHATTLNPYTAMRILKQAGLNKQGEAL